MPATVVRPGPYDALVRALRSDPAVSEVALIPTGGALSVVFADGASLVLAPRGSDRSTAFLTCLHSTARGQGAAGRALRALVAHAAACGAAVDMEARPYGDVGLNAKALKAFYARVGFRATDGRSMMTFRT